VRSGTSRLLAFIAVFVVLTLAGAGWALSRAPVSAGDLLAAIAGLGAPWIAALVVLCAGIYATDVLRYRSLGQAVNAPVTWRAGLDASVANFLFSWVTPGSTFGAPATIYMLGRQGVPWDAAVVIAFGKAFTGVAVIVVVSLGFIAFGLGPDYDPAVLGIVLFGGSVFAILFGLLVAAAVRPEPARRVVSAIFGRLARKRGRGPILTSFERVTLQSIHRLVHLRDGGPWPLVDLALTHVLYFIVFGGMGCALMHAFGGTIGVRELAATIVYIMFTYLAPTPGGAGFAEAMAIPFFGPLLPADKAVMFVLCFRGLTLYLQVGIGIPYLLVTGGVRQIVQRPARADHPVGSDGPRS
jgi:hypothetical protein